VFEDAEGFEAAVADCSAAGEEGAGLGVVVGLGLLLRILACPVMMIFMTKGVHGDSHGPERHDDESPTHRPMR